MSNEALKDSDIVRGKAKYKDRDYILVWEGTTKFGEAAKLAFTNGLKTFWVKKGLYEVTKIYKVNDYCGRKEYMTFGKLKDLREDFKKAKEQGNTDGICNGKRYECEECGEYVVRGNGTRCWE